MALRGFALVLGLLGGLLLLTECAVFINQQKASSVLRRYRRYNTGYFEEMRQGNLEQECIEEICDYEEAREVFEDDAQTVIFWKKYIDPCSANNGDCEQICRNEQKGRAACSCADGYHLLEDQKTCEPSDPCSVNNGDCGQICRNEQKGRAACSCVDGYHLLEDQKTCVPSDACSANNGDCEQICRNERIGRAACSCVDGYHLLEDQKTCEPSGPFSCGTITLPEAITSELSSDQSHLSNTKSHQQKLNTAQILLPISIPDQDWGQSWRGQVPWQVYLFGYDNKGLCEGVLISDRWALTAAHCLVYKPHTVVAGEYDTVLFERSEQIRRIVRVVQHPSYNRTSKYENDLVLLGLSSPLDLNKYVTPICLGNRMLTDYLLKQGRGTLSGWWKLDYLQKVSKTLQRADIQYVDQVNCLRKNETQLPPNTFCAGHPTFVKRVYHGNSGAPVVTERNNMWFLTGIAICGAECTGDVPYDIFTSIATYVDWIHNVTRAEQ